MFSALYYYALALSTTDLTKYNLVVTIEGWLHNESEAYNHIRY